MGKEGKYNRESIERSLNLADKYIEEGKALRASRALTVALNHARGYEGPDRNAYLERIEQHALTLEEDRTLEDHEYEHVQGIEEHAVNLRERPSKIEGLLPAVVGGVGLIIGLFFLSPNISGNVVGSLTQNTSNWVGVVALVVGILGFFVWRRK